MPVTITTRVVGLRKLQNATKLAPGILYNREIEAMNRSVSLVKSLLVGATPRGPGHFGFHMIDRWSSHVQVMQLSHPRLFGVVSNSAVQSRWLDKGTKAHEIHAKPGSMLWLRQTGGYAAVVHHPGVKARHIGRKALKAARPAIKVFFFDAARGVVQSMATSGD
jgi:hypothetical protein